MTFYGRASRRASTIRSNSAMLPPWLCLLSARISLSTSSLVSMPPLLKETQFDGPPLPEIIDREYKDSRRFKGESPILDINERD